MLARDESGAREELQRGGRPLLLLAWLAAHPGRWHSRATLAELFWPSPNAERSRRSLRQALVVLRRLLGEDALDADRDQLRLRPGVLFDERELLVARVESADFTAVRAALRGPYLWGSDHGASAEVGRWVIAEREALRRRAVALVGAEVSRCLGRGDTVAAREAARVLAAAFPEDVDASVLVIDSLLAAGAFREVGAMLQEHEVRAQAAGETLPDALHSRRRRFDAIAGALVPLAASPAAKPTPAELLAGQLVGRDALLRALTWAVEEARAGRARRILLHGIAGSGKSRLLDELEARTRLRGARVVRLRIVPASHTVPWAALAEIVRALMQLPGAGAVPMHVAELVVGLVPDLRAQLSGATPHRPTPDDARRVYGQALGELVHAVAEERLTLLLIDDEQYLDDDSRAALDLLKPTAGARLLEVRTRRTMVIAAGERDESWTIFALSSLERDEVRGLLERVAALPDEGWVEAFTSAVVTATRGSPLGIQSVLRLLAQDGLLQLEDGSWKMPDVEALIAGIAPRARPTDEVRTVSAVGRTVLAVLAHWNRPLDEGILARTVRRLTGQRDHATLRDALRELEGRGLATVRDVTWAVAHDTIVDAVLADRGTVEVARVQSALLRSHAERQALDPQALERLALCAGSHASLDAARELVDVAARDPRLRAAGLYGDALVARVVAAAGHPEWEPALRSVLSWSHRHSPRALVRIGVIIGAVALGMAWLVAMLIPRLVIESPPMGERGADGVVTLVVQPRVGLYNGFGRLLPSLTASVRARSRGGALLGDTLRDLRDGQAQFTQLAIVGVNARGVAEPPTPLLEFDAGWLVRAVQTPVVGAWDPRGTVPFRVIAIELDGKPLDETRITQAPLGVDSLRFVLTFEYTTVWATANYVVAAAANWTDRQAGVIRLVGLPSPVRRAWRTVGFTVPAPKVAGEYYIVIAMGAEDSADHLLSATNWTLGTPRWGDGNDLVELAPSLLDSLRLLGRIRHDGYLVRGFDKPQGQEVLGEQRRTPIADAGTPRGTDVFGTAIRIRMETARQSR